MFRKAQGIRRRAQGLRVISILPLCSYLAHCASIYRARSRTFSFLSPADTAEVLKPGMIYFVLSITTDQKRLLYSGRKQDVSQDAGIEGSVHPSTVLIKTFPIVPLPCALLLSPCALCLAPCALIYLPHNTSYISYRCRTGRDHFCRSFSLSFLQLQGLPLHPHGSSAWSSSFS